MMTLEEIAEELRVSVTTVLRLIEGGELKGAKVRGQWRVRRKDFDDYLRRKFG